MTKRKFLMQKDTSDLAPQRVFFTPHWVRELKQLGTKDRVHNTVYVTCTRDSFHFTDHHMGISVLHSWIPDPYLKMCTDPQVIYDTCLKDMTLNPNQGYQPSAPVP